MRLRLPRSLALVALLLPAVALGCGDSGTPTTSEADSSTGSDTTGTATSTAGDMCPDGAPVSKPGDNLMTEYGAPCTSDADCVPILGEMAMCVTDILDAYTAPGGYCSLPCDVGSGKYVEDAPECGPGITCIGADFFFEACTLECQSDDECQREGYECRVMPVIGADGDPKFCLMVDECQIGDAPPP